MDAGSGSALLAPQSVAIVGASDDPGKTGFRPLRFLRTAGWQGQAWPVARRATVGGETAFPSLDALPGRPDHAFVLLGTEAAMAAVADCVRLGIPAVTVMAAGFAEAGPEGQARQAALAASVSGSGTRLLGPSSLGLVVPGRRLVLTANAAFAEPDLPAGGLFVASQSGSLIGALASRGRARGFGFAGLVSVGGEADLSIGEICAATLDDPSVTAYLLFLESLRATPALRDFAARAAARGRPVVAYRVGRSAAAAELAQSHTGAMAGEDDVAAAFLADCGIARVDTMEALLEAPALLARIPAARRAQRPRIGVVTTTGGGAAMAVDRLGLLGIEVAPPGPDTVAALGMAGVENAGGRILDLTLAGTRPEVMRAALAGFLADPGLDAVLAVVGSSARFQPDLAVQPIAEVAAGAAPLAAFLVPEAPEALAMLARAGVPCFRTPEGCADAFAAAFARRPPVPRAALPAAATAGRMLDELSAHALLDRLGIPRAPAVAMPALATTAPPFGFPVVAKILSAEIGHKSDVGGVRLNLADAAALAAAGAAIARDVGMARPDADVSAILVSPMVRGLGEVLIGWRHDAAAGPVVLLAPGGVLAELAGARSLRCAPITREVALEMIAELPALRALAGYRGRPAGDLAALADALVALSRTPPGEVLEIEVNPLAVMATGVMALDALAVVA